MRSVIAVVLIALAGAAHAADPDALWKIVHNRCVPNQAQNHDPKPCAEVTLDVAVLKDLVGVAQYLLIPTAQIAGMESPALLAAVDEGMRSLAEEPTVPLEEVRRKQHAFGGDGRKCVGHYL